MPLKLLPPRHSPKSWNDYDVRKLLWNKLCRKRSRSRLYKRLFPTRDLEARLVRISLATQKVTCLTLPVRPLLHKSETNFSRKRWHGKSLQMSLEAKAVQENWEAEKAELVKP